MRNKVSGTRVTVRAISGTYVVFLAFDMKRADIDGLQGFAIQRSDLTESETIWLRGNKTFAAVRPSSGFEDASSHEHPFQAFQWADYSAKPGYKYQYKVVPMYGRPGKLKDGAATVIPIETEAVTGGTHDVHFNRGAIASQAFARRFPGQTLDQAGEAGYAWLTRDLLPGLLEFIGRAKGQGWGLRAAIYEMKWPAVLEAFRNAHERGADVKVVYHAVEDDTGRENEERIQEAKIRTLCKGRAKAKLMHNKFVVLLKNKRPVAVWTGSTNLSRNALFGQLNVGHMVDVPAVAGQFLDYWAELHGDPEAKDLREWAGENNPLPPTHDSAAVTAAFSPHSGRAVLDWWIDIARTEKAPLFMTFPFGMSADFREVFDRNDGVLRFALLDKYVNGGNADARQNAIDEIERIRRYPNVGLALGERIFIDWLDGWHQEGKPIGTNVNWVHTKFMLVDPLGEHPVTLSGSANFSLASVRDNDENMLVIRGDKRVADIYFGEFMRVFAHHRFRESVKRHVEQKGRKAFDTWKPQDLFDDWKKWAPAHFKPGSEYDIKRRYFIGE